MKRGLGLSIAWIGATIVAVVIAGAAVGSVRSHVTKEPTALGSPTAAALAVDIVPTTIEPSDPSLAVTTTVPQAPPQTPPSIPQTVESIPAPAPVPSSSTTQPTASTKTYNTAGGTVRITISDPSVTFSGAVPNPGWKVEIDHAGPDKVKVTFKQNDHGGAEIEFRAQFDHGELLVSIDDH